MKAVIVDYGIGNLHSIRKGLEKTGAKTEIVSDMNKLESADCIVFPGVGAFGEAMRKLEPIREIINGRLSSGIPVLGICLGMQILLEDSEESREKGLGFVKGRVKKFVADRVPQMGWNDAIFDSDEEIFKGVPSGTQFYFANSYVCFPEDGKVLSKSRYGEIDYASAIRKENVFGFQFHPEKSSIAGLKVLKNFVEIARGL
ncbi:MAG: imidazole glycerol phosphate synthase subunit HisH [Thermoplasmata archaeon]|nr:imidazole glycerol phosphate synthase subunit HisH [Thermoplasmata archaeon]